MTSVPFIAVWAGWLVALYWSRTLARRGYGWLGTLALYGGGGVLMLSQVAASSALVFSGPDSAQWVRAASWLGIGTVVALLLCNLAVTIRAAR